MSNISGAYLFPCRRYHHEVDSKAECLEWITGRSVVPEGRTLAPEEPRAQHNKHATRRRKARRTPCSAKTPLNSRLNSCSIALSKDNESVTICWRILINFYSVLIEAEQNVKSIPRIMFEIRKVVCRCTTNNFEQRGTQHSICLPTRRAVKKNSI